MTETIMVSLLSLIGNVTGSVVSIIVANRLIAYRVEKLEERVSRMEVLDARIYELEKTNTLQNEKIENTNDVVHDIRSRLERFTERMPLNA